MKLEEVLGQVGDLVGRVKRDVDSLGRCFEGFDAKWTPEERAGLLLGYVEGIVLANPEAREAILAAVERVRGRLVGTPTN